MPKFHYKARSKAGALVHGQIEAADTWLARKALAGKDLTVVEVGRYSIHSLTAIFEGPSKWLRNRVTIDEKLMLISQLETGVSIGIPVLQVLDSIARPLPNPYLREVITSISNDVGRGTSLSEAFGRHPEVFDPLAIGLIHAGERTGELEATLSRLGLMLEQQVQNRARIKSATFYPKVVMFFMTMVIAVVVYFVIPKFKTFLNSVGQDLPPITRLVVGVSDFFVSYWYLLLGLGFAGAEGYRRYTSTERGKLRTDQLKLKLPFFGPILAQLELNNYCILLSLLLNSGMTLFDSLRILGKAQTNQVYRNEIDRCAEEIRGGRSFGRALEASRVFPPNFTSMIGSGEESGQLPKALQKLGNYYQIQVNYRLDNLSKVIEPLLLGIIFMMVGTVALAVFLPIWKVSSAISAK